MSLFARSTLFLAAVAAAAIGFATPQEASARTVGAYSMEVLINGVPRSEYMHGGGAYIEALQGQEYAVRITNHSGQRVAVALAVDGLNSIDARHTTARGATKWVLGPYQSAVIEGWQVSEAYSRSFYFTTPGDSYGSYVGDTRNLGVISAVFFTERRRQPIAVAPPQRPHGYRDEARRGPGTGAGRAGSEAGDASASVEQESAQERRRGRASSPNAGAAEADGFYDDGPASTGIGDYNSNQVSWTDFELAPGNGVGIDLRYEFRDELVAMGILPPPYRPRPYRRGYPTGFAPNPPR